MSKSQYVKDIGKGAIVNTELMVFSREIKSYVKDGKESKFLQLELGDNTGKIPAVCFDDKVEVEKGDVLKVNSILTEHREYGLQLKLSKDNIKRCDEFDIEDFLPKTSKDIKDMLSFVKDKIKSIENEHLSRLLHNFFDDKEFIERFKKSPAGVFYHHNFIGGLLEHTVNVIRICDTLCKIYPKLNRDLLATGAILHDIGKLYEYQFDKAIDVSEEGGLTGHIIFGDRLLNEKIKDIADFPSDLRIRLHHLILSHHIKLSFGSPKAPKFLEAVALGYADYLDSKVQGFSQILDESKMGNEVWKYNDKLGQYVYLK